MRDECLEPYYLTLEVSGVVKFQINLLLGKYVVELMYVTRETHQIPDEIIRVFGWIAGRQYKAGQQKRSNQAE